MCYCQQVKLGKVISVDGVAVIPVLETNAGAPPIMSTKPAACSSPSFHLG